MKSGSFLKPYYPHQPIGSVNALARKLGVHPKLLRDMAAKSDDSYTTFLLPVSESKTRTISEPKFELKKVQKRINSRIFESVEYPYYLSGGIKDSELPRDWVFNGEIHKASCTAIKLDIKNFYPNIRYVQVDKIFRYLFKFPPEVSSILGELTTLHGSVPQGACTSSYIANLVFFDREYQIVSDCVNAGLCYSRLLDDITVSSSAPMSDRYATEIIKKVSGMCRKKDLRLNNKKTKIARSKNDPDSYVVTGVWVRHNETKLQRSERRYIRQLVYVCECEYGKNPCSDDYHKLWNKVSGKVAKMSRLGHGQARKYRARMKAILPLYNEDMEKKLTQEVKKLAKLKGRSYRIGHIKRVNRAYYHINVLGRSNGALARSLREQLANVYGSKTGLRVVDYWDG